LSRERPVVEDEEADDSLWHLRICEESDPEAWEWMKEMAASGEPFEHEMEVRRQLGKSEGRVVRGVFRVHRLDETTGDFVLKCLQLYEPRPPPEEE
jgi:hypothetical protein